MRFSDSISYSVKKTTWSGSGMRTVNFKFDMKATRPMVVTNSSSVTDIGVPQGLPKESQPSIKIQTNSGTSYNRQKTAAPVNNYNPQPRPSMNSNPPRPTLGHPPVQARPLQPSFTAPPAQQQFSARPSPSRPPFNAPTQAASRPAQPMAASMNQLGMQQLKGTGAARPMASTMPHRGSNTSMSTPDLLVGTSSAATFGRNRPNQPVPPKPTVAKPKVEQCKALYDYNAREADELTLKNGDVITLVHRGNNDFQEKLFLF